ncbi:MAG: HD domain-containing protein [Chloroflexi bacterium]|nr:HD domain-containing protein [Chloroflexota bacterium]
MHWNAGTLISLVSTVLYGAIFGLVAFSRPRNQLRRIFALYLLAMVLWSSSAFLTTSGLVNVLTWFKIMAASPIAMMVGIFYFVQTLFGLRRKWAPLTVFYAILAVAFTVFSDLVVLSASLSPSGELHYELNTPVIVLLAGVGYFLIVVSLVDLIKGLKHTQDANHRQRLRYLVIGLSITIVSTAANFTELGKYPIDVAANVLTAILIAYAILRHNLLDIKVVVRLGILYSVITAILGSIYFLVISLVLNIFNLLAGEELLLISILVGALSGFILTPLRNLTQTSVDRLFYREKYNAGLMLQRLSQTTVSVLDLDAVADLVLSEIIETLHINHGAIMVKSMKGGYFRALAQRGETHGMNLAFEADHPIVRWMKLQNRILTKHDLSIHPTFKALWGKERQDLARFQIELFIPLLFKGDLVGYIVLGPRRSGQPYTSDDLVFLSTLSNQTAVTVENARLFDELEETFVQTVSALANAIDIRDSYTSSHSQEIAGWAAKIAEKIGCRPDQIKSVYWGGVLHDIGKIGIPDEILRKKTSLDRPEWDIIYQHTRRGAEIIAPIKKLEAVAPIIASSHERYDGLGYPMGIKGEEIPLGARIVAVVDSFSAMISERPYKKPYTVNKAIHELKRNIGKMYDPAVVQAFLEVLEIDASQIDS